MQWIALASYLIGLFFLGRALDLGSPQIWQALSLESMSATPALILGGAAIGLSGLVLAASPVGSWLVAREVGPAVRGWRWAFVLVVAIALVHSTHEEIRELENVLSRPTDFGAFHAAARAASRGADPYAATDSAYFYPPTFAHAFRPLAVLPLAWASSLWYLIKVELLAVSVWWVVRLIGVARLTPGRAIGLWFGVVAVSARFWMADLQFGNTNVLILFLVTAVIALDRRGAAVAAGLSLAAAITIKLVPGLLAVWLLARGRWGTLVWALLGLMVVNLVPFTLDPATVGSQWDSYVEVGVTGKLSDDLAQPDNQSLWGALARGLPEGAEDLQRWLWAAGVLTALAAAALVTRRVEGARPRAEVLAASIYPGLVLVASPGSWVVHYVLAMLPMAALLLLVVERERPWLPHLAVFVAANLAFTVSGWSRPTVRWSIEQSWFLIALVLVLITLLNAAWRQGGAGAAEENDRAG